VKEEKRKKRTVEYLQRLWDEVLEEEAVLLGGAEGSQIMGSKCKEVTARDKEVQQPSKKARGKQPGKVRKRGLRCLPPVSILVLFFLFFNYYSL